MTATAYNPHSTHPRLTGLSLLLLAALAAPFNPVHAAPADKSAVAAVPYAGYARSRLLVQPRAGLPAAAMNKEVRGMGANQRALFAEVQLVNLPAGVDEIAAMNKLRASGKFKFVELDMAMAPSATVSDPSFSKSWGVTKINAPLAWDNSSGDGIIVAVLDTGVLSAHPDLAENMVAGWNAYDNNADTTDVYGHGTMVSGTIVMAANNDIGSAGVAHRAKVMPIRISDINGYGYWSTVAAGIQWAADHGARVANVSYDGMAGSSAVQAAADYMRSKGGLVVVAAGNSGSVSSVVPSDKLIVVSSTDSYDAKSTFSTWGGFVDVAAPGSGIFTTNRDYGYASYSGTSFASPITAATVALIFSANPALTPEEAETILFSSAVDLGDPGKDIKFGHGRINAAAAVEAAVVAAGGHVIRDSVAPVASIASPAGGANLAGLANVNVAASDDRGVASVSLYLNGSKVASDTMAPYAFAIDTTRYANGSYTLVARALDASGNLGESTAVAVNIANASSGLDSAAPVVGGLSVTDGQNVSALSSFVVSASATDDVGVTGMEVLVNGASKSLSSSGAISTTVYVSKLAAGNNVITIRAKDKAGNVGEKSVTVVNGVAAPADTTAPLAAIGNPVAGATVSGVVSVSVSASDDRGVTNVDLYLNGSKIGSDSGAPYAFSFDSTKYANGSYTLLAKAVDAAGNLGQSATVTVNVANVASSTPAVPGVDSAAPVVGDLSVTDGQNVSALSSFVVSASATDDVGVTGMEVLVNGATKSLSSTGAIRTTVYVSKLVVGSNVITIRAKDKAGNVGLKTVTLVR